MAVEAKDGAGLERARYLGRSIERREDNRLLTGRQRYMDDVVVPGMLEAALVRSPFAHARIRACANGLHTSAASSIPGTTMSSM